MKQMLKDLISLIGSLSNIDILLYIAVLVLIILIVSLIYIIKTSEEEEDISLSKIEEKEDLKTIIENIEKKEPPTALTDFEAEQEEKAIISYEELVAKNKLGTIRYEEENTINDEVSIKKINLDSLLENPEKNKTIGFYTYEREEEFLKTLKALNKLLN